jgi:hypothetical protein
LMRSTTQEAKLQNLVYKLNQSLHLIVSML